MAFWETTTPIQSELADNSTFVYLDLHRAENEKIVEHWGFHEMLPPPAEWKNSNGML
jgi:predicted SnoaL-like aldol condensation-catalyzing enzyme